MRISKVLSRLGPAFVVGACIIGPGSVMLMSKTGALYGYSMLWLSVLSGVLTCGFIILFMRFGIYSQETFLDVDQIAKFLDETRQFEPQHDDKLKKLKGY